MQEERELLMIKCRRFTGIGKLQSKDMTMGSII